MTLSIALWSVNLSHPVATMTDWAALADAQAAIAKKDGADILLMPEYASEQWMHTAGKKIAPTEQIRWMADQVETALPLLSAIAKKHDILLAAGTFAHHYPGGAPPFSNRAHIFFPSGERLTQDKLCLTPKEKNPDGWNLSTGSEIKPFMWRGYKIAVFICLDIELPALSAKIAAEDLDLILVPSMTKTLAGYHRVYDCAKARAVELQCAVAVCGAIGHAPARNPNISGASVFVPCEEELGSTGALLHLPPVRSVEDAGLFAVKPLPLDQIRALRRRGAEVWPGAFDAGPVKICGIS